MSNYSTLKDSIAAQIKQNGRRAITGEILKTHLLAMVNSLGANYQYRGVATTSTNPGTPDQNIFYIASTAGTYTNMGGFVLAAGEVAILKYNGSWSKDTTGIASNENVTALIASVNAQLTELGQKVDEKVDRKGGKNLFSIQAATVGKSIRPSDGNLQDSSSLSVSEFVPVLPNTTYIFTISNSTSKPGGNNYYGYYAQDKSFISAEIPSGLSFTTPNNCYFVRVPIYTSTMSEARQPQLEKGDTKTAYTPYNPVEGYVDGLIAEAVNEGIADFRGNVLTKKESIRLNGIPVASPSTYVSTEFLLIDENYEEIVIKSGACGTVSGVPASDAIIPYQFYDGDKEVVGSYTGVRTSGYGYSIKREDFPENAVYVRICCDTSLGVPVAVYGIPMTALLPEGANIPIDQTTGGSTTSVMSQKATTDAINNTKQDILKPLSYKSRVGGENKLFVQKEFSLNPSDWQTRRSTIEQGENGLKITANPNGNSSVFAMMSFENSPLDLSRCQFGVDLTVNEGTPSTLNYFEKISEIDIALCSESSFTDANCNFFPVVVNAVYILHKGQYKVSVPLSIMRGNDNSTIDLASVKWVAIRITLNDYANSPTPSITVNRLFTYTKPKRKQVVFGFDGASEEQLTPMAYLSSKGLPGVVFTPTHKVGGTGYMTKANLYNLQDAGHLVAMYALPSDNKYWYQMTHQEKEDTIIGHEQWLYENGFGNGAKCISVPGGGYAEDDYLFYTSGLVTCITGMIVTNSINTPVGYYGPYSHGHSVGPNGSVNAHKLAIDALISDGGFVIFIFHKCIGASDDITLDQFKEIADYVAEKSANGDLEVITAEQLATYTLSTAPTQ